VEIEQRIYEPERRGFHWDSPEMRILYRILDWAESRHLHVFLQQMWSNTAWNAYPELRDDLEKRVKSAPLSLDDFAYGLAELVQHLVKTKGYTSIRWLAITNEPDRAFSWWQGPDLKPVPRTPGFKAVHEALDRRGISLPISGPDWADLPPLEPEKITFDPFIGAYDIHSYSSYVDRATAENGPWLASALGRISDWVGWVRERNKPFFLTELGSFVYGWGGSNPAPGGYEAGMMNASLVVGGINAGVDGFNRWSFLNRGDLDGQWQLVDTWDVKAGRLLPKFTPHAPAYYMWGILSRYMALNSEVLATRVEGGEVGGIQRLIAA
jgi:hypothetical protein